MFKLKNYKLGFDYHGLIIFIGFILPYIIYFVLPEKNEVLKEQSVTRINDYIGLISNALMILSLTFIVNKTKSRKWAEIFFYLIVAPKILYFACWILFYFGLNTDFVIVSLVVIPAFTFLAFSISRKNLFGFVFALIFTITDIIFTLYNFIL